MKEVTLVGTTCHVFSEILTQLLERGLAIDALVDDPERLMLQRDNLMIGHIDAKNEANAAKALAGATDVILAYDDNLSNAEHNELTLKSFVPTLTAARQAGVKRVVVVGSPDSSAFFVSELKRIDDLDWVFVSTEGDFAKHSVDEIEKPLHHKSVFAD